MGNVSITKRKDGKITARVQVNEIGLLSLIIDTKKKEITSKNIPIYSNEAPRHANKPYITNYLSINNNIASEPCSTYTYAEFAQAVKNNKDYNTIIDLFE